MRNEAELRADPDLKYDRMKFKLEEIYIAVDDFLLSRTGKGQSWI